MFNKKMRKKTRTSSFKKSLQRRDVLMLEFSKLPSTKTDSNLKRDQVDHSMIFFLQTYI